MSHLKSVIRTAALSNICWSPNPNVKRPCAEFIAARSFVTAAASTFLRSLMDINGSPKIAPATSTRPRVSLRCFRNEENRSLLSPSVNVVMRSNVIGVPPAGVKVSGRFCALVSRFS